MANLDVGNRQRVIDKRAGRGTTTSPLTWVDTHARDVSALRARLAVKLGGTTYTTARLDTMTKNDMLYALRVSDDPAGVV